MTYQEINIQTHTDTNGVAHLNIDTGVIDKDVSLTISYKALEEEDPELNELLSKAKPATDFANLKGAISLKEDPLSFQKNIRDEW